MSFRFLTAGESHGKALVGILEGLPSGLKLEAEAIHAELKRRKMGYGRGSRQKIEDDALDILTGIRHGKTLGSPITLLIWNKDYQNWGSIMQPEPFKGKVKRVVEVPRPGHADLIGALKYDHSDMRNVLERASARETAIRVALGTLARFFLEELDIYIGSRVVSIGSVQDQSKLKMPVKDLNSKVDKSPVRCLGKKAEAEMIMAIDQVQKKGDTLGGIFEVYAEGLPLGLGSYVQWDRRLEGEIGRHFLSMNAIKGVEVGMGIESAVSKGSEVHDELFYDKKSKSIRYETNKTGGIIGGMTNGDRIVVRAAMKPIATLMKPLRSFNLKTKESVKAHVERSDYCAVPSAAVIGESLLAFVLAESILEKFGGDSMKEIKSRVQTWKKKYQTQN